jgi:hypothetical protein
MAPCNVPLLREADRRDDSQQLISRFFRVFCLPDHFGVMIGLFGYQLFIHC